MTSVSPRERLLTWCSLLERIIVGRGADNVLATGIPDDGGLIFVVPTWLWTIQGVDVGAKGVDRDGNALPMPVRIHSPGGPVQVHPDTAQIPFTARGLNVATAGVVTLSAGTSDCYRPQQIVDLDRIAVHHRSASQVRQVLQELSADGQAAWFEAIMWPEPQVLVAIEKAHTFLACEVADNLGQERSRLIDQVTVQQIADAMMLGRPDDPSRPSPMSRIIEKSVRPLTFAKVDPLHYLDQSVRRDAHDALRQYLGDPSSGSRIRRSVREVGGRHADPVVILEHHNRRHPNDNLGMSRLSAALQIAPSANAVTRALQSWAS